MDSIAPPSRRPWLAVVLGLLCNGLGHVYVGRVSLGVGVFAAWLVVATGAGFGLRLGPGPAIAGIAAALCYWLGQAVHAGFMARGAHVTSLRWLSRPLGLFLLYVAATGVGFALGPLVNTFVVQTYVVPAGSMIPALEIGDLMVVVPGARVERGAIVVHAAPPGARSRDPLVKRVVAAAGDTVEVRDGQLFLNGDAVRGDVIPGACTYVRMSQGGEWQENACRARTETLGETTYRIICAPDQGCGDYGPERVPPGHVFVLGDHRDNSADSRHYGPIPEQTILGRVRWIPFSMGPHGVRRERVGLEIP